VIKTHYGGRQKTFFSKTSEIKKGKEWVFLPLSEVYREKAIERRGERKKRRLLLGAFGGGWKRVWGIKKASKGGPLSPLSREREKRYQGEEDSSGGGEPFTSAAEGKRE